MFGVGPLELFILGAILGSAVAAFVVMFLGVPPAIKLRNLAGAIRDVARESQDRLNVQFAAGDQQPESALDQLGLRDGFEIVDDFLKRGEIGLAFDHLLYMVFETSLELSFESRREIKILGMKLGVSEAYRKQFNQL